MLQAALVVAATATPAMADGGAWNAANAYYDPAAMARARRDVQANGGGMPLLSVQADRLEYQSNDGSPLLLWDVRGWYGGDRDKLWVRSEGTYLFDGGAVDEAEVQARYSRAVSPYFDLQIGVRQDFGPGPSRTHGVIGIQGLAPHWFEIDAALFVSDHGDLTARLEAEYDLFLTQRLILQPRLELDVAFQDVAELGIGSGLSSVAAGARLRYEIDRQFAPYVGVSWTRKLGGTADFARASGEAPGGVSFVAGVRWWF
ncbi:MAG: copper resistance protein B [Alphaproteobacteria bacterium]|nr:copper resistance protein B [Alphaproteobacteria bacterium]